MFNSGKFASKYVSILPNSQVGLAQGVYNIPIWRLAVLVQLLLKRNSFESDESIIVKTYLQNYYRHRHRYVFLIL